MKKANKCIKSKTFKVLTTHFKFRHISENGCQMVVKRLIKFPERVSWVKNRQIFWNRAASYQNSKT